MSQFKAGDIVFALDENGYHHTSQEKKWVGIVTSVSGNGEFIAADTICYSDGSGNKIPYKHNFSGLESKFFSPIPPKSFEVYKFLGSKSSIEYKAFSGLFESGKKKKAGPEINTKHLDKLVVPADKKKAIVEVLEQHKHEAKIFDKWGLKDTIEYGRGMTMLFWGPPGTGKTWATTCIAKALGKGVISIGAAEIQSSEPGGANRAIQEAFATAKSEKKVLFLDECDSLITNRAHVGMILGSEINTLLTEIEKFEGVCVLSTNRIDTLDPALERRISLIMEFPEPDFEGRMAIWKNIIPKKFPLDKKTVTFEKLAEYALTGGLIKNALLNVARAAASAKAKKVTMKHFDEGIKKVIKSQGLMGKEQGMYRAVPSVAPEKVRDVTGDVIAG